MEWLTRTAQGIDVAAAIADYRDHGFALLREVVSPEGLDVLRDRARALMLGLVPTEPFFFQHDTETGRYDDLRYGEGFVGPSENYRKIEKLERDPHFRAFLENPLFRALAEAALGPELALYRAILMGKAARGAGAVGGTELPFHQDAGALWGLDRDPELQLWTALDDAPIESGCLAIVPRSHLEGLATPLGGMIPAERVDATRARERAVFVPARAGDVVVLHNLAWHASAANRTDKPRRGFSVCFLRADTRCVRKRRAPRTFPRVFVSEAENRGLGMDRSSAS